MEEVLGSLNLTSEEAKQRASQIWSMLDDMASNDPEAYKKFVDAQMSQAAAAESKKQFTPSVSFTVRSTAVPMSASRSARTAYVNVCHSKVIQPPSNSKGQFVVDKETGKENRAVARNINDLEVPLTVGKIREVKTYEDPRKKSGKKTTVDVVDAIFHPWVTARCCTDPVFQSQIVELAVYWAGKENGVAVSKDFEVIRDPQYIGGTAGPGGHLIADPYVIDEVELEEQRKKAAEEAKAAGRSIPPAAGAGVGAGAGAGAGAEAGAGADKQRGGKPVASGAALDSPSALLDSLRSVESGGSSLAAGAGRGDAPSIEALATSVPSQRAGKGLIEEIGAEGSSLPVATVSSSVEDGTTCVVLVELPGLTSMKDVELDVDVGTLRLNAPGFEPVVHNLPSRVKHTEAAAKFKRKVHTLTVRVPLDG